MSLPLVLLRGALERLARRVLQPAEEKAKRGALRKAESFDIRVLEAFVDADGRLKTIPAARKKRGAVLRWLMRDFEEGRRYSEAEVNARIQRRHWDSATLRRELIGHRMMARAERMYWRLPESEWRKGGEA